AKGNSICCIMCAYFSRNFVCHRWQATYRDSRLHRCSYFSVCWIKCCHCCSWRNCNGIFINDVTIYKCKSLAKIVRGFFIWLLMWDVAVNLGCGRAFNQGNCEIGRASCRERVEMWEGTV